MFSNKVRKKLALNLPPGLKSVAALPFEICVFNYATL